MEEIEQRRKNTQRRACVFWVPESLRNERPGAYVPRVVSLGPFHHFKSEFSRSENYKTELLVRIIKNNNGRLLLATLAQELSLQCGERIRKSYEQCEYSNEVLGWIMAKDALFLLDVLRFDFQSSGCANNNCANLRAAHKVFDPKVKGPLLFAIHADILKMENQVPMFVLEKAFKWEKGSENVPPGSLKDMLRLACREFSPFINTERKFEHCDISGERHLLEYLYNIIVSRSTTRVNVHISILDNSQGIISPDNDGDDNGIFMTLMRKCFAFFCSSNMTRSVDLPSATELQLKGVKFEAFNTGNLDEIRFDKSLHTFHLPAIRMDDRTEVVLRNLVAHEAMVELETRTLLSYVDLMDRLIDTPSDVAVLKSCGVLRSYMGSDKEVANAWNGMGRSMWKSGYGPVDTAVKHVILYYKSRYRVIFAELMQVHFSKPWTAVSVFGAFILLALSLLQTILQFEQLCLQRKPPK